MKSVISECCDSLGVDGHSGDHLNVVKKALKDISKRCRSFGHTALSICMRYSYALSLSLVSCVYADFKHVLFFKFSSFCVNFQMYLSFITQPVCIVGCANNGFFLSDSALLYKMCEAKHYWLVNGTCVNRQRCLVIISFFLFRGATLTFDACVVSLRTTYSAYTYDSINCCP